MSFTSGLARGDELVIPVKHGVGNWVVDDGLYSTRICPASTYWCRSATART